MFDLGHELIPLGFAPGSAREARLATNNFKAAIGWGRALMSATMQNRRERTDALQAELASAVGVVRSTGMRFVPVANVSRREDGKLVLPIVVPSDPATIEALKLAQPVEAENTTLTLADLTRLAADQQSGGIWSIQNLLVEVIPVGRSAFTDVMHKAQASGDVLGFVDPPMVNAIEMGARGLPSVGYVAG